MCHHIIIGSIRVITDTTGAVVNRYAYYPFGDSLNYSGTLANELQFTSKSNVPGMEAYDFSARYYDPAIGRFYSIDPLFNPATSPYAYCGNNPVNYIDPTGMAMMPNIYQDGTAREVPHGLGGYSGSGGPAGSGWTLGSGHQNSWATWGGSSRSYTDMIRQTDPEFYASYVENSYISYKMFEAVNAPPRVEKTPVKGTNTVVEEITIKKYFNVIDMTEEEYVSSTGHITSALYPEHPADGSVTSYHITIYLNSIDPIKIQKSRDHLNDINTLKKYYLPYDKWWDYKNNRSYWDED